LDGTQLYRLSHFSFVVFTSETSLFCYDVVDVLQCVLSLNLVFINSWTFVDRVFLALDT